MPSGASLYERPKPQTLNPQTLNLKPQIPNPNPKPQTLNPKPENPKP